MACPFISGIFCAAPSLLFISSFDSEVAATSIVRDHGRDVLLQLSALRKRLEVKPRPPQDTRWKDN
jgi:hypothetical protein